MKLSAAFRRGELYALALIGLSVIAFGSVSFVGDSGKFAAALGHVGPSLLLTLAGLACVNYLLRAARFQLFARRLGIVIPFGWMLLYYVAGFAMSATPGKLGELMRLWLMRQRHGYRIERSLPLQITDRAIDVVATVVLCVAAFGAFTGFGAAVVGAGALVACGVVLLMQPALLYRSIDLLYRWVGRKGRWFARARRIVRMVAQLFEPRMFLPALLLAIVGWWAECLALNLCIEAVTGVSDLERATFIFTFSNLVGGLTFLPGGVGGTEVSMAGLLVAGGADVESAAIITAVIRLATLWFGTALGLLVFAILARGKSASFPLQAAAAAEETSIAP